MNTNRELDQIVRTWLEDRAAEPSRSGLEAALDRVAETPQQRHRWLGRWLGRGGGATRSARDRGHPSGSDTGRNRLMFSLTTVAASMAALALVATLVVPRGDPGAGVVPGAPAGATHVVAADGSGDFTTIGEAVAAASDGDTVLVTPGEYAEALVIDKDITLQGDGPREEIVITYPEGLATNEVSPYGDDFFVTLKLADADATVAALTVSGAVADEAISVALEVQGGAPLLEDLALVSAASPEDDLSLLIVEGAAPTITGSTWSGYVYTEQHESVTMEGNTISGGTLSLNGPGSALVRDNVFADGAMISASDGLTGLVEGNDFAAGPGGVASNMAIGIDNASDLTVRGNTFAGRDIGVSVDAGSSATIEDNEFTDDGMAVTWGSTKSGTIAGNAVRGGFAGIMVTAGSPTVSGNTIEDVEGRGLVIGKRAHAIVEGNTVCGCGVNLAVTEGSDSEVGANDICEEGSAG